MGFILVIGGARYIGSHTVNLLKKSEYNPIVYDNLSKGYKEVPEIFKYLKNTKPEKGGEIQVTDTILDMKNDGGKL